VRESLRELEAKRDRVLRIDAGGRSELAIPVPLPAWIPARKPRSSSTASHRVRALDGVRRRAPYAQHRNDDAEARHG
jgi:hypothetical protein